EEGDEDEPDADREEGQQTEDARKREAEQAVEHGISLLPRRRGERLVDQHPLLQVVARLAPGRGARALLAGHGTERETTLEDVRQVSLEEGPRPHVPRLLLDPHEI